MSNKQIEAISLEQAAKLALEALEAANSDEHRELVFEYRAGVITALREALAEQPRAEGTLARESLTDEQIDKAAMKLAECMDFPWAQMPEQGKQSMRSHAKAVIEASGITKGQK